MSDKETLTKDTPIKDNISEVCLDWTCEEIQVLYENGDSDEYWMPTIKTSEEDGDYTDLDWDAIPEVLDPFIQEQLEADARYEAESRAVRRAESGWG